MPAEKGVSKPRKPTHLKAVRGTLQPSRSNAREPQVRVGMPAPPDYLSDGERQAWCRLAQVVEPMQVCSRVDFAAFESMATAFALCLSLRQSLREAGDVVYETFNERGGVVWKARPELAALAQVEHRLMNLLGRFGLTPADRSRVKDLSGGKPTTDPEDEFAQRAPQADAG